MNFRVLEQRDLENARSPFRVVQDDGGEVGWVNRFLDRQRVRCVADSSLRGYAHDLLHFLRWWAGVSHSPEISEEAGIITCSWSGPRTVARLCSSVSRGALEDGV